VDGKIRLLIALDVKSCHMHAAGHGRLKNGRADDSTSPLELPRTSNTNCHDFHTPSSKRPKQVRLKTFCI